MLAPPERRNSFKANVSEREEIDMSGAAEQFDYIVVGAGSAGASARNGTWAARRGGWHFGDSE